MKALLLFAAVLLPAAVLAGNDEPRLCPDGYTYVGDDATPDASERDWVMEEIDRTGVYSCYKLVYDDKANWLSANTACQEEDAQLVSFEVTKEMQMVEKLRKNSGAHSILTSAMEFSDGYYWVGSYMTDKKMSKTIQVEKRDMGDNPAYPESRYSLQCVALVLPEDSSVPEDSPKEVPFPSLKAVPCTIRTPAYDAYMCEARVQTVTYITWFQANWLDFILTALIIILFTALCVTLCCYPSQRQHHHRSPPPSAAYRGRRRPRTTDDVITVNKPPAYDMPPAYGDAVRVHRVESGKQEPQAVPLSMMDRFKKQGSELVAKVYYYRTPARTDGNSNA